MEAEDLQGTLVVSEWTKLIVNLLGKLLIYFVVNTLNLTLKSNSSGLTLRECYQQHKPSV